MVLLKAFVLAALCVLVAKASSQSREEYLRQLCIDCEDEDSMAPEDECYRHCWSTGNRPVNHVPAVPLQGRAQHTPTQEYLNRLCPSCGAEDSMAPEDECARWCQAFNSHKVAISANGAKLLSECEQCKKSTGRLCNKKCKVGGTRKPRSVARAEVDAEVTKFNISEYVKERASEGLKRCLQLTMESACELVFAEEIFHKTQEPKEFYALKQTVCDNCNDIIVYVNYGLCFKYCHFDGYTFNVTLTLPPSNVLFSKPPTGADVKSLLVQHGVCQNCRFSIELPDFRCYMLCVRQQPNSGPFYPMCVPNPAQSLEQLCENCNTKSFTDNYDCRGNCWLDKKGRYHPRNDSLVKPIPVGTYNYSDYQTLLCHNCNVTDYSPLCEDSCVEVNNSYYPVSIPNQAINYTLEHICQACANLTNTSYQSYRLMCSYQCNVSLPSRHKRSVEEEISYVIVTSDATTLAPTHAVEGEPLALSLQGEKPAKLTIQERADPLVLAALLSLTILSSVFFLASVLLVAARCQKRKCVEEGFIPLTRNSDA